MLPIKNHITSGCVLLDSLDSVSGANVLMIFRKWEYVPEGAWILPKGHVEEGETLENAAIRETVEETGYQNIQIKNFLSEITIKYEKNGFMNIKKVHWFLALLNGENKFKQKLSDEEISSEIFEIKWVPLINSVKMSTFNNLRHIILFSS
ncbi:MAG: NUDIX domain-containing protein [Patescibacteria group bacterium]